MDKMSGRNIIVWGGVEKEVGMLDLLVPDIASGSVNRYVD